MTKKTHLAREMSARHIQMIALGGVIGTGLFLSSGYTIHHCLFDWRVNRLCRHAMFR